MRILIVLLVLIVGGLHVLDGQLAAFTPPRVEPLPPFVPVGGAPVNVEGAVSDIQRFLLADAAGWSIPDAIIAVAISIAEDGSGSPAALSAPNFDNSRDLGLWQINSSHWDACGGQQALTVPANNAACAHMIYAGAGWCSWSTYGTPATCGRGHTNSYAAFLERARSAATSCELLVCAKSPGG